MAYAMANRDPIKQRELEKLSSDEFYNILNTFLRIKNK
jgi:hypothetical protein